MGSTGRRDYEEALVQTVPGLRRTMAEAVVGRQNHRAGSEYLEGHRMLGPPQVP